MSWTRYHDEATVAVPLSLSSVALPSRKWESSPEFRPSSSTYGWAKPVAGWALLPAGRRMTVVQEKNLKI